MIENVYSNFEFSFEREIDFEIYNCRLCLMGNLFKFVGYV